MYLFQYSFYLFLFLFFLLILIVGKKMLLYIISGILASLNEDKLGYQYLWPGQPDLNMMRIAYV